MGKVIEHITAIKYNLTQGPWTSDQLANLSERAIFYHLNMARNYIAGQNLKKAIWPNQLKQWLHCVELECSNNLPSCCGLTSEYVTENTILKSKLPLPETIPIFNPIGTYDGITGVTTIDRLKTITLIPSNLVSKVKHLRFTSKFIKAFIEDSYLYILNNKTIEAVSVQGVFANPMDVSNFCESCFDFESNYPMPENWTQQVLALASDFIQRSALNRDGNNDANAERAGGSSAA